MLSGAIKSDEDLNKLIFPMIASPKLDGIRTLGHKDFGAVTRKLKPVPNKATFNTFKTFFELIIPSNHSLGLDGELCFSEGIHNFQRTSSAVMSFEGEPKLTYYVFDAFDTNPEGEFNQLPYEQRIEQLSYFIPTTKSIPIESIEIKLLPYQVINDIQELLHYEQAYLAKGFEGVMLRSPHRPYKCGRSAITKTQQHLVKLKRFVDAEGKIIDYGPLQTNQNELESDNFGYAKRSSSKEGKIDTENLGYFTLEVLNGDFKGKRVQVGSGFSADQRREFWLNKEQLLNKVVTFKYQAQGSKDAPRFPIFKAFRKD